MNQGLSMKSYLLILFFALGVIVITFEQEAISDAISVNWQVPVVVDSGIMPSLVVDQEDNVLIAYIREATSTQNLCLARLNSAQWSSEIIISDTPFVSIQLVLNRYGVPHVAYSHGQNQLDLAKRVDDSDWSIEALGQAGKDFSIAFDNGNQLHLAAINYEASGIQHAWAERGAWNIETLQETAQEGVGVSLTVGATDTLFLASYDQASSALRLMSKAPEANKWTAQTIIDATETAPYQFPSLAIDTNGRMSLGFIKGEQNSVAFGYRDGLFWDLNWPLPTETFFYSISPVRPSHIALDASRRSWMAHVSGDSKVVVYVLYEHGLIDVPYQFQCQDNEMVFPFVSLAFDKSGAPHLAFSLKDANGLWKVYHVTGSIQTVPHNTDLTGDGEVDYKDVMLVSTLWSPE